jgi:hypothetical protein
MRKQADGRVFRASAGRRIAGLPRDGVTQRYVVIFTVVKQWFTRPWKPITTLELK